MTCCSSPSLHQLENVLILIFLRRKEGENGKIKKVTMNLMTKVNATLDERIIKYNADTVKVLEFSAFMILSCFGRGIVASY